MFYAHILAENSVLILDTLNCCIKPSFSKQASKSPGLARLPPLLATASDRDPGTP